MKFVSCTYDRHAPAILEIFNEAILHSTALYDYHPRTPESMVAWFGARAAGNFPVIGLENAAGELLGFGTYGTFRAFPAYKYSVEHSIYVDKSHRGKGCGVLLLQSLIDAARLQQLHVMVGGIDAENTASIALHRKLGFEHAGTIRQAGFKFGHWLDLAYFQLILETPHLPMEG
ncbi:GNAT family N-acetyltransferase [Janthinobacterium sp. 17J80-10]|uniref:GNAT family N-acetyltransferase n=1 Tax=Janthinobacterium sp. 17J80-10 TaxID=2497863 RepID=UPI001005A20F|nr:GNAT family N-acetyltransferase [Janthinobacterium sp. 17J80-10]QAU33307.1 N-acetyltransferase family protein [Janthinobacterium sp. 17J80-10]